MNLRGAAGLKRQMTISQLTEVRTPHRRRPRRPSPPSATPQCFDARRTVLDAVVVGGGPAGLSAALVLGRARQSVLVLDSGKPANAAVSAIGGLLAQSATSPLELRESAYEQLAEHEKVVVRNGAVAGVEETGEGFEVRLDTGECVRTRSVVIASGLRYDPPPLPGIRPLWGRSVFHCPFCDGWEVRDRPIAVHGNGPAAAASALFVRNWSSDVVLLTDGPADLGERREALDAAGVRIREQAITSLVGEDGALERIEFLSGAPEYREALFVRTRREQANDIADSLGCTFTDDGTIEADVDGRTGIEGVYAAGDAATGHSRSVANAIGTGSRVAYALTVDLTVSPTPALT